MGGHALLGIGKCDGKESGEAYDEFVITETAAFLFPKMAHEAYRKSKNEGVSTAYAKHPQLGRAVIAMSNLGSYIVWKDSQ